MKKNEKILTLCNLLMYRQRISNNADGTSLALVREIAYLMNGNPNLSQLVIFASDLNELKLEIEKEAKELGFDEKFLKEILK